MRHHTVIGGHDQHHDVGHIGAAGAHGAEGRVARRIQKGDLLNLFRALGVGKGDGVSADMLGDAAGFARSHVGLTNGVQQRRLAMVHVTHDGDNRRAGFEIFRSVIDVGFGRFLRGVNQSAASLAFLHFEAVAVLGAEPLGDGFIDGLIHVGHHLQLD